MKIGYVRVSTKEQDESDSLVQQTSRVEKAGAALIFSDIESGRSDSRKQFNKMLALCKEGKVKEVIVTRIDRLARSVITIHRTLVQLEQLKVKLNVLDSPIDTASPFGWFSVSQMASLAEFESRLMSSRIKHGYDYFREQKKASSQPLFGYKRINEKYSPDYSLHEPGVTYWQIAREIIDWFLNCDRASLRSVSRNLYDKYKISRSAVGLRYWLLNPALRGHTAYNQKGNMQAPEKWQIYQDTHQALMSEIEYQAINRKLETNKQRYSYGRERKSDSMFLPFVYCGECGGRCFVKASKYSYRVRCGVHDTRGNTFCKNNKSAYLSDVISAVDEALRSRYRELCQYTIDNLELLKDNPELAIKYKQLEGLRALPQSPLIAETIANLMTEIEVLKQQEQVSTVVSNELQDVLLKSFSDPNLWKNLQNEEKKPIYDLLVEKVVILNGAIVQITLRV